MSEDKAAAIIAAGGSSARMEGVDKLFAVIAGKPLLAHTVAAFEENPAVSEIVVVCSEDNVDKCRGLQSEFNWDKVSDIVAGGKRRQDSVYNGLQALGETDWVLVHDGARPLVNADIINRGLAAAETTGAAIAAVPVKDTIKLAEADLTIMGTPPRENLWAAQTPQVFRRDILKRAFAAGPPEVSDDAALVERLGIKVKLFHGSYDNIKVTTPSDLKLTEILLKD